MAALVLAVAAAALLAGRSSETRKPAIRHELAVRIGGLPGAVASAATPLVGPAEAQPTPPAGPDYAIAEEPPGLRVHLRFRKRPPRAALLWDIDSGRVLWSRNPNRVLPIASVTKMMTALLVVENALPYERVRVTREALHYQGSGIGLLPKRRRVRLETMLAGLLLPSGNDAAIALAQHVGGSIPRFVRMMNARAARLGLRCTHFSSPSGIDDRDRSCAPDLARLAREALAKPRLARIVASRSLVLPFPIKGGKLYLNNNNTLMRHRYRGVDGVKTGYTDLAGHCLVGSATRGGVRLGIVLLHSPDTAAQGKRMLDRGFALMRRAVL